MPDLSLGSEFAGLRIDAEVKRGGMGVVYRATDLRLKRTVALKVIAPELAKQEDFRARFEREWSVAAGIDHPNVIPVYHSGEEEGVLYTTMLWVEGKDLGDLVAERGPLPLSLAVDIISQVAAGLDAAHGRDLIHRDVKPGNVLLREDAEKGGYRAYLSDFGLTKRLDGRTALTMSGMFVGTVDYIAPEQLLGGEVDGRADIYALGCVLFYALSGHPPFGGETDWATLKGHESGAIPSLHAERPDLPEEIDTVIDRALAKEPERRYPSAGELARAVASIAEAPSVAPESPERTRPAAPRPEAAPTELETRAPAGPEPTESAAPGGGGFDRRWIVFAVLTLIIAGVVAAVLLARGGGEGGAGGEQASAAGCREVEKPPAEHVSFNAPKQVLSAGEAATAVVETSCGKFEIELATSEAPKTTNSFAFLAEEGFYDDTIFHRVVKGFVIQGGDPLGTGLGGPGYSVDEKPPESLAYTKGVVAMAKSSAEPPGRSGSQFFVVTAADAGLPPEYALVGRVSEGMDVVDRIGRLGTGSEKPSQTVLLEKMTIEKG